MTKKQLLTYTEKNSLFTHVKCITDYPEMQEYLIGYEKKSKKGYAPRYVVWFKISEFYTSDGQLKNQFVNFDHEYDMYYGKSKRGNMYGYRIECAIEKSIPINQ